MPVQTIRPSRANETTRSNITRRRTGCIPCRDRHVRCDERKPICARCDRSSTDCVWNRDIKIVLHSPTATRKKSVSENSNASLTRLNTQNEDEDASMSSESTHSAPGLASLQPTDIVPEPYPEQFTDWATLQASELVQEALSTELEVRLMHNYLTEVAPWFDAHTGLQYYSRIEVPRMLSCPPWRAAALAISAKNIECRERTSLSAGPESLPLHLYQLAVRLAIDAMSGRFETVGALAGCVLLCVYEMMTVTYTDWRRHVQGCAAIYSHNRWNGSTGGLISGSFWDYARIGEYAYGVVINVAC